MAIRVSCSMVASVMLIGTLVRGANNFLNVNNGAFWAILFSALAIDRPKCHCSHDALGCTVADKLVWMDFLQTQREMVRR